MSNQVKPLKDLSVFDTQELLNDNETVELTVSKEKEVHTHWYRLGDNTLLEMRCTPDFDSHVLGGTLWPVEAVLDDILDSRKK